jgi:hypothetical protein
MAENKREENIIPLSNSAPNKGAYPEGQAGPYR